MRDKSIRPANSFQACEIDVGVALCRAALRGEKISLAVIRNPGFSQLYRKTRAMQEKVEAHEAGKPDPDVVNVTVRKMQLGTANFASVVISTPPEELQ